MSWAKLCTDSQPSAFKQFTTSHAKNLVKFKRKLSLYGDWKRTFVNRTMSNFSRIEKKPCPTKYLKKTHESIKTWLVNFIILHFNAIFDRLRLNDRF